MAKGFPQQGVKEALNQGTVLSFNVTTTDATSTEVITATDIAMEGHSGIRDIHIRMTGDKGFLGLGKDASKTHGRDIIPVWKNTVFDFTGCYYDSINVIRSGSTNVTVEGWVTIR